MAEKAESSTSAMLKHAEEEESKTTKMKIAEEEDESKKTEEAIMEQGEEEEEVKKIRLKTEDGVIFEVEASVVKEMKTVQIFVDDKDNDASVPVPLLNVTSATLGRILELKQRKFDKELAKTLSRNELFELILAANYLDMYSLLDFAATSIADFIKNKSPGFVREYFSIANDLTPEEEAKVRQDHAWAHGGVVYDD